MANIEAQITTTELVKKPDIIEQVSISTAENTVDTAEVTFHKQQIEDDRVAIQPEAEKIEFQSISTAVRPLTQTVTIEKPETNKEITANNKAPIEIAAIPQVQEIIEEKTIDPPTITEPTLEIINIEEDNDNFIEIPLIISDVETLNDQPEPELIEQNFEQETFVDLAELEITQEFLTELIIEPAEPIEFSEFMVDQADIEPVASFDELTELTSEQPLEKTIFQFVELLAEDQEILEDNLDLKTTLQELQEIVLACRENNEETPAITPELMQKLVKFVEQLGYEKPAEALIECIKNYGFVFLWQAIEYAVDAELDIESVALFASNTRASSSLVQFLFNLVGLLKVEPVLY